MNLLELQTRANALVQKVNEYEETIAGVELDENTILNEHTYVDLFSLRMIMHRLFGTTPSDRSSNLTTTDGVTWYYLPQSKAGHIYWGNINNNQFGYGSTATTRGRFSDNNDLYTNYNMLVIDPNLSNAWQYSDASGDKERLITTMANTVFGADIRDALVTESQTANIFKWNTTSEDDITSYASAYVVPQQVPGIVCYYLGSGYDGTYTATVPFNTSYSTNQPNNATPALYGAYYIDQNVGPGPSGITSQQAENRGAEGLRMFMPGLTYFNGTSISPINIWQPFPRLDTNYGYNYQGKALYHELVFKRRRAGCKEAGLDFIPDATVDNNICDNDPQGLAMRLALAQQKPYYYNRPWFKELDEYYTAEGTKQAQLADLIVENSKKPITEYDLSDWTTVGTPTVDGANAIVSNVNYNKCLTKELNNPELGALTSMDITLAYSTGGYTNPAGLLRLESTDGTTTYLQVVKNGSNMCSLGPASSNAPTFIYTYNFGDDNDIILLRFTLEDGESRNKIKMHFRNITQGATEWTTVNLTKGTMPSLSFPASMTYRCSSIPDWSWRSTHYLQYLKIIINGVDITPKLEETVIGYNDRTDSEFYNGYQLSYDTYAEALGEPQ